MTEIERALEWREAVKPMLSKAGANLADAIMQMPSSLEKVKAVKALDALNDCERQLNGNIERGRRGERVYR
ncbi:MAG TPA: hypothetical protein VGG82_07860 [Casimicrobiaceae bacterium]|jgi:hypothetical protein